MFSSLCFMVVIDLFLFIAPLSTEMLVSGKELTMSTFSQGHIKGLVFSGAPRNLFYDSKIFSGCYFLISCMLLLCLILYYCLD